MGVTISILELRVNETTMQKNLSRLLKKFWMENFSFCANEQEKPLVFRFFNSILRKRTFENVDKSFLEFDFLWRTKCTKFWI